MANDQINNSFYTVRDQRTFVAHDASACFLSWELGGTPTNTVKNMWLTGISRQKFATIARQYYQSACNPQDVVADGADITPPADPVFTVNAMRHCGGVPKWLTTGNCSSHFLQVAGKCSCINSLKVEWDFIVAYEFGVHGLETFADDTNAVASTPLVDTKAFVAQRIYFIGRIQWKQLTVAEIGTFDTQPLRAIEYYGDASCVSIPACNCNPQSLTGLEWVAKLTGLADNSATLHYTTNSGDTWTSITLQTGAGVNRTYTMLFRMGQYLGVLYKGITVDTNGYELFTINNDGTLTNRQDLNSVFPDVSGQGIRDVCVLANGNVAFMDGTTRIYVVDNLTTGNIAYTTENASISSSNNERIACCGNTIVLVARDNGLGGAMAVLYSNNYGESFMAATTPAGWGVAGFGLWSVWMHSTSKWDIGTDDGQIFRTCDSGNTWTLVSTLESQVTDIAFPSALVGYATTMNEIYWTLDGGSTWCPASEGVRLTDEQFMTSIDLGMTSNRGAHIAFPTTTDYDLRANHLSVGGGLTDTTGWCMRGFNLTA